MALMALPFKWGDRALHVALSCWGYSVLWAVHTRRLDFAKGRSMLGSSTSRAHVAVGSFIGALWCHVSFENERYWSSWMRAGLAIAGISVYRLHACRTHAHACMILRCAQRPKLQTCPTYERHVCGGGEAGSELPPLVGHAAADADLHRHRHRRPRCKPHGGPYCHLIHGSWPCF